MDKKLGGVATVQTLSRLNRKGPPAKQDTMVLDFVNKQEDIEKDFQDYYGETRLDRGTDPQKLYNMKFEVEAHGVFLTNNIESLRKQKFADSLESVFISSAGDFYSVLNRMSKEPDFKRLLTEFALAEFKKGLESPTDAT